MAILGQVFGYDVLSYGDPALGEFLIPGTSDVRMSIRRDVAAILVNFAADFNATVQRLRAADSGAHNPRVIAGTTSWSRHAAGIAMDLNWQLHPQGQKGTFTPSQVAQINVLLGRYVWNGTRLLRWGVVFSNPDEMHFEINVAPGVARAAAAANVGGDMELSDKLTTYGLDVSLGGAIATIYSRTDYLANKLGIATRLDAVLAAVVAHPGNTVTMSDEDRAKLAEELTAAILDGAAARLAA